MTTLNESQIEQISGGVSPMLVVYAAYTFLGPAFALGFASAASRKAP